MSSNSYSTFQSYSSSSYSDSTGTRYEQKTYSNPSGTTTQRNTQEAGKPMVSETTNVPSGRHVGGIGNDQRRIEDVTDDPAAADKKYEERIEDEYAKREGGA
ncbi:uncharacterized protein KY384_004366 [Bacidia gigantensis]|uniref:uncharacterized protein n=1 Tax=Bacidia gigantensis TaxID=2732470 RepID=UPI001D04066A|nr:uncharacterized protein KY384_004366 [Bacidia gigantensis]KAG8531009.1 hypothetical protein KY384_004366 [Bacidia gigantensis]